MGSLVGAALSLTLASAISLGEANSDLRDPRIFAIDFGNSTTTLASLSALGSLVALKAKIAVVVAVFWAAASLFAKWAGSFGLCRSGGGAPHPFHDSFAEHYGGSSLSPVYQDAGHSHYGHSYSPSSGLRPARTTDPQDTTGVLREFVELAKDRVALADLALGAIDNGDCRRRLLCLASSFLSGAPSGDGDDGGVPWVAEETECMSSKLLTCPTSRLSNALSALSSAKHQGF